MARFAAEVRVRKWSAADSERRSVRRGSRGEQLVLVLTALVGFAACKRAQYEGVVPSDAGPRAGDGAIRDGVSSDKPVAAAICSLETPRATKGKAQSCRCDQECQTGFCVDGVCCSSACTETCKACNLPSSLGDCALVPAGGRPSDPTDCVASTPATCGRDGTCDGRGGCRLYVKGTECKAGRCDGDRVTGILTCDGNGQCSQAVSEPCPPYSCDPATQRCAIACTTDALCASGQQCVAERCGKSVNGATCQEASDCASGFCVDGVCCNVACSGSCVSCNQTGSVGRCTYVAAGLPDPTCQASDPATCGRTGLCDGFGSCTLFPENTICGASSCTGLMENTPRTCDGRGTCRLAQLVDCAPFLCSDGTCQTSCDPKRSDSCETGHACVAQTKNGVTSGFCGQRKNGQPCQEPGDCESGQCVDSVCCENECTGACRSCNLPGSPGQCLNVADGAPDPRNTCRDLGASACSTNGVCDGKGACQTYAVGTQCGGRSCLAGAYTPPPTCNATGQCVASRSRTCNPFACNGDTCFTACSTSDECAPGEFCTNGSCGLKPRGADCTASQECASGFCAQGVCCDGACTGACMTCDLLSSAGTCTAVDQAPDPQGKCASDPAQTCGTTGACSKGACAYYEQGRNCRPATCATAESLTPASTCDGKGSCTTPAAQSCGTFACEGGACKTSCTAATQAQDCVPPNTCLAGSCGLKVNGAACTDASECQSGFCTEGVCCNTRCADAAAGGLCKTCKGTRTSPAGTCANVESGSADPKGRCSKSAAGSGDCSNDGTCNGSGACRPWSSGTGCRPESCQGSTHTLPATCDGAGKCPAAVTASCGDYVCSVVSPTCLYTCTTDADCANQLTCLKTNNRCGDKLPAGETCVASSDCGAGLVCSAEGVCCDRPCDGGCQSCKLAGKTGVCSNLAGGMPPRSTSPATCAAAAPGACGASGNCDGSGGCEQRTLCTFNPTTCPIDLHEQYIASGLCSAAGVCGPVTQACSTGYLCVPGGACATSCTPADANANCDVESGYNCVGGFCRKKAVGSACQTASECANGNCVDGFCCSSPGCPDCQSCNIPGHEGACWNVPANSSDGACVGSCPSPVQASGLCDGAGACKPAGACAAGYVCAGGICTTSCASDADCASGYACAAGGICRRATGQTCAGSQECASGNCVDGRCCSTASCADCTSCDVAGHEGVCFAVPAGTADGTCVARCTGSEQGGLCDGNGACRALVPCPNGYLCSNGTECAASCTTSCASGYYCDNDSCRVQKANGDTCAAGRECLSGQCVDGFCCASASCSDCLSCDVVGHQGACYPVAAGVADGACLAHCPAGSNLSSGLCDGNGACRAATPCPDGNLCDNNDRCATDCTAVGCSPGYYCSSATCVAGKTNGDPCAADSECASGHCVADGVGSICCSTTCTDVTCGTRALCGGGGNGCQTYGEGSACQAGAATCSVDGHSSLQAMGTCSSGACQPTAIACLAGYLCVGQACVEPGGCSVSSGCDAGNSYFCNTSNGNCEPQPLDAIDAGQ
jgi:hypothetical protein